MEIIAFYSYILILVWLLDASWSLHWVSILKKEELEIINIFHNQTLTLTDRFASAPRGINLSFKKLARGPFFTRRGREITSEYEEKGHEVGVI